MEWGSPCFGETNIEIDTETITSFACVQCDFQIGSQEILDHIKNVYPPLKVLMVIKRV